MATEPRLSCYGGCSPGAKLALRASFQGKAVGTLCEACVRDGYALRTFTAAAGWLYGWRSLTFTLHGAAAVEPLRQAVQDILDDETSRADEARLARLERRIRWAMSSEEVGQRF